MSIMVSLANAIHNREYHLKRWMGDLNYKEYQQNVLKADSHMVATLTEALLESNRRIDGLESKIKRLERQGIGAK